ncbi:Sulfur carrier protein FdhD [Streptomyces antimycoticus]
MGRVTERRRVIRIRDGAVSTRPDTLVAEEPLEIRLNGKPLAITMRTPGDDFALAAGFLVSEGVLGRADELANIVYCAGATEDGSNTYNVVDVTLAPGVPVPDITLERNVYTTSSCGLCGKASLDAVRTTARWPLVDGLGDEADGVSPPVRIEPETLSVLPDRLRAAQRVFDRTGGLHAAGLFTPPMAGPPPCRPPSRLRATAGAGAQASPLRRLASRSTPGHAGCRPWRSTAP